MIHYLENLALIVGYVIPGFVLLLFCLWVFDKITWHVDFYKEIIVDKNDALSRIIAAFIIGVSIIIALVVWG